MQYLEFEIYSLRTQKNWNFIELFGNLSIRFYVKDSHLGIFVIESFHYIIVYNTYPVYILFFNGPFWTKLIPGKASSANE